MSENSSKGAWFDPRFILTLVLVVGGGIASYSLATYRISQLEAKVQGFENLKLELMQKDVRDIKSIVRQIATKNGIVVAEP